MRSHKARMSRHHHYQATQVRISSHPSAAYGKVKLPLDGMCGQAGHSGRVRPGPIPNPEVKPAVAAVLLTCVSGREAAVLAPFTLRHFLQDESTLSAA